MFHFEAWPSIPLNILSLQSSAFDIRLGITYTINEIALVTLIGNS